MECGSLAGSGCRWIVISTLLVAIGCPGSLPRNEEMVFACAGDGSCGKGFRCVDRVCVAAGELVDAAISDGSSRDASVPDVSRADLIADDSARLDAALLDLRLSDSPVRDTIAVDVPSRDAIAIDSAQLDSVLADTVRADGARQDRISQDRADPDRGPADTSQRDTRQSDTSLPDIFRPDASGPSVVLAHRAGTTTLSDVDTVITTALTPAVDPTKSILAFDTTTNSNAPSNGHVGGQLVSNGAAVRFQRGTAATGITAEIAWTVVELDGISVQRGTEVADAGTLVTNAHLGRAVDLAKTFPLYSFHLGGGNYNDNDWREASFVDNQNLRFERVQSNDPGAIDWQVVEFLPTSSGRVRSGRTTMAGGSALTAMADVSPVTDPGHTFLIFSYQLSSTGTLASQLVSGRIDSASQLSFERAANDIGIYLTWFLVEWDAMNAQHGSLSFNGSQQDRSATLGRSVDPARAVSFCPSYQRQGMTDYTDDDVIGAGWFTTRVTGSGSVLTAHRAAALGNARVDWSVVEFR